MNTSDKIDIIAPALVEVQSEMVAIKDANNPFFKSKYAPLDEILKSIRPALKENGLTVIQSMDTDGNKVNCTTRILHTSGQWIDSMLALVTDKPTPQGFGSAATYARRYGLCAALSISTPNEDDDGNKAEENGAKQKAKRDKQDAADKKVAELVKYKDRVTEKLVAYDPEIIRKVFDDSGYASSEVDFGAWLADVVGQVDSKYKLDGLGKAVRDENDAQAADK
jgi:hypothetical protein